MPKVLFRKFLQVQQVVGSIVFNESRHRGCRLSRAMAGVRSHEELIVWKLSNELKLHVYSLLKKGSVVRDFDFCDQIRRSASSAPRNIAEGFGRYLPGDFVRYLRFANGELKETYDALQDGCDRGHFTRDEVIPLQRLSKRASKAATNLIAYLEKNRLNKTF